MNIQIKKEEFENACQEVLEILKFVKDDDLRKIPSNEIENLKKNANAKYQFSYDATKDIKQQNVSKTAKGIIANYFIKYIATPEQRQKILEIQHMKISENKPKFDTNNILRKDNENIKGELHELIEVNNEINVYKKESWFKKFINKILKILHFRK